MEADETLTAAELVPGGRRDAGGVGGRRRWPAHLPLLFKARLLPVGVREHDLSSLVLWQMM